MPSLVLLSNFGLYTEQLTVCGVVGHGSMYNVHVHLNTYQLNEIRYIIGMLTYRPVLLTFILTHIHLYTLYTIYYNYKNGSLVCIIRQTLSIEK